MGSAQLGRRSVPSGPDALVSRLKGLLRVLETALYFGDSVTGCVGVVLVFDVRGNVILLLFEKLQHCPDRRVAFTPWPIVLLDRSGIARRTFLAVFQVQVRNARV